ncbi:hypothetical protein GH741_00470 [Aquibacillus halophilus]|uniref:Uncharacterized protein n=1 Tax=Aquibacillus halophilus TaxID=930132 RepID=A0A6A8D9D2_9BACI|nr:hypothetical protein [Aquibacillus halophilus]MRH41146.1 hypothetical protein [Aquibacillus halophilus]
MKKIINLLLFTLILTVGGFAGTTNETTGDDQLAKEPLLVENPDTGISVNASRGEDGGIK